MIRPIVKRIKKDKYEISIIGNRDPRGNDNEIVVEVNEADQLIITVGKADRCYSFKEIVEEKGYIQIIAD